MGCLQSYFKKAQTATLSSSSREPVAASHAPSTEEHHSKVVPTKVTSNQSATSDSGAGSATSSPVGSPSRSPGPQAVRAKLTTTGDKHPSPVFQQALKTAFNAQSLPTSPESKSPIFEKVNSDLQSNGRVESSLGRCLDEGSVCNSPDSLNVSPAKSPRTVSAKSASGAISPKERGDSTDVEVMENVLTPKSEEIMSYGNEKISSPLLGSENTNDATANANTHIASTTDSLEQADLQLSTTPDKEPLEEEIKKFVDLTETAVPSGNQTPTNIEVDHTGDVFSISPKQATKEHTGEAESPENQESFKIAGNLEHNEEKSQDEKNDSASADNDAKVDAGEEYDLGPNTKTIANSVIFEVSSTKAAENSDDLQSEPLAKLEVVTASTDIVAVNNISVQAIGTNEEAQAAVVNSSPSSSVLKRVSELGSEDFKPPTPEPLCQSPEVSTCDEISAGVLLDDGPEIPVQSKSIAKQIDTTGTLDDDRVEEESEIQENSDNDQHINERTEDNLAVSNEQDVIVHGVAFSSTKCDDLCLDLNNELLNEDKDTVGRTLEHDDEATLPISPVNESYIDGGPIEQNSLTKVETVQQESDLRSSELMGGDADKTESTACEQFCSEPDGSLETPFDIDVDNRINPNSERVKIEQANSTVESTYKLEGNDHVPLGHDESNDAKAQPERISETAEGTEPDAKIEPPLLQVSIQNLEINENVEEKHISESDSPYLEDAVITSSPINDDPDIENSCSDAHIDKPTQITGNATSKSDLIENLEPITAENVHNADITPEHLPVKTPDETSRRCSSTMELVAEKLEQVAEIQNLNTPTKLGQDSDEEIGNTIDNDSRLLRLGVPATPPQSPVPNDLVDTNRVDDSELEEMTSKESNESTAVNLEPVTEVCEETEDDSNKTGNQKECIKLVQNTIENEILKETGEVLLVQSSSEQETIQSSTEPDTVVQNPSDEHTSSTSQSSTLENADVGAVRSVVIRYSISEGMEKLQQQSQEDEDVNENDVVTVDREIAETLISAVRESEESSADTFSEIQASITEAADVTASLQTGSSKDIASIELDDNNKESIIVEPIDLSALNEQDESVTTYASQSEETVEEDKDRHVDLGSVASPRDIHTAVQEMIESPSSGEQVPKETCIAKAITEMQNDMELAKNYEKAFPVYRTTGIPDENDNKLSTADEPEEQAVNSTEAVEKDSDTNATWPAEPGDNIVIGEELGPDEGDADAREQFFPESPSALEELVHNSTLVAATPLAYSDPGQPEPLPDDTNSPTEMNSSEELIRNCTLLAATPLVLGIGTDSNEIDESPKSKPHKQQYHASHLQNNYSSSGECADISASVTEPVSWNGTVSRTLDEESGEVIPEQDDDAAVWATLEREMSEQKQTEAATKIQAGFRGHRTRQALLHREDAVQIVTSSASDVSNIAPAYYSRDDVRHSSEFHDSLPLLPPGSTGPVPVEMLNLQDASGVLDEDQSAAVIMARSVDDLSFLDKAATKIQSTFRGFRARNTLKDKSPTRRSASPSEAEAATKIQAGFRGYQVRKQMRDGKRELPRIQSAPQIRIEENIEDRSATTIQAGVRGFLTRQRLKKERSPQPPTISISEATSEVEDAVVKIQAGFRGYKGRQQVKSLREGKGT